ncbi:DNA methyltransferase [Vreelandella massiliensis]|uniref:DNA methyltransferase n=1 Tax=Vreelandella massiliensis TaxID=1816686 RepID=UPI00096A329B|nr:DNA methyltransferase [Halomonas massiliensis]
MNEEAFQEKWTVGTSIGRWSGMGPYYAMFPVSFARSVIEEYSQPGQKVIDPFCGRGTTNYVSRVLGRDSFGCEINPVGWVYASVKTDPYRNYHGVIRRIEALGGMVCEGDKQPENEFQTWAWHPDVLGFLQVARRELDWKGSRLDRTVMSFLLVYLHAKIGGGLSNQMRQSKSMSPEYSIRWWKEKGSSPPKIDPVAFLVSRVLWRYKKGFPGSEATARIFLGDARDGLKRHRGKKGKLILTSPPYLAVTNYEYDNWIRLWLLGGAPYPSWSTKHRHAHKSRFEDLLHEVFQNSASRASEDVSVVVRTDAREMTLNATISSIRNAWDTHRIYSRHSLPKKRTQTALFGDKEAKPGEVDIIALPSDRSPPDGFLRL